MRSYDLTPFLRSTVGFDKLFNDLVDNATKLESGGYPPYNIVRTSETDYEITLAVAGFSQNDLEIEVVDRELRVSGRRDSDQDEDREYLHQGIAGRNFDRRFRLAEHLTVRGAQLENGLLTVLLALEIPEAKKPRKIEIGQTSGDQPAVLSASNAA